MHLPSHRCRKKPACLIKKKTKGISCKATAAARRGSPFHKCHCPDGTILTLAWCWVNELHGKAAAGFCGVTLVTVYKWYKVFRGVAENVVERVGRGPDGWSRFFCAGNIDFDACMPISVNHLLTPNRLFLFPTYHSTDRRVQVWQEEGQSRQAGQGHVGAGHHQRRRPGPHHSRANRRSRSQHHPPHCTSRRAPLSRRMVSRPIGPCSLRATSLRT